MDRILKLDGDGYVAGALQEHKRLVMSLLEDEYLSSFFWQEPSAKRAGQSRKAAFNAQTWYIEERWTMVLDEILDRVYLMRRQLVHGAATYGGKLNRTSLKRSVMMMHACSRHCCWSGSTMVPTRTGGRCATRLWAQCRGQHPMVLAGRGIRGDGSRPLGAAGGSFPTASVGFSGAVRMLGIPLRRYQREASACDGRTTAASRIAFKAAE